MENLSTCVRHGRSMAIRLAAVPLLLMLAAACASGTPAGQPPATELPRSAESPTSVAAVTSTAAAPTQAIPSATPIPSNPEVEAHLANARDLRARGQSNLALIEVEQALAIDPSYPDTLQLFRTIQPEATNVLPTAVAQATAAEQFGRGQATVAAQVEVVRQLTPAAMGDTACRQAMEIPNPWCYTFVAGREIANPPPNFCTFFACAPGFFEGQGHVVQCRNLSFRKTGGLPGSCAEQGGEHRTLFDP